MFYMLPKITVIMPVYNGELYIREAISSITTQTYKNIDIIIIDDGSKDKTPDICDDLSKQYSNIHVIHIENSGVSAARNKGIEHIIANYYADNSYIAFCDADDLLAKDCLTSDLENYLDQDIICFQSCSMSHDTTMCSPPHSSNNIPVIANGGRKAAFRYPFHFGAFLYKLSLFKDYNIRFDTSLKYNEDKVLQMQLLYLANSIRYIPKMMYLYRKNPASVMHKRPHGIRYYEPLINGWMCSDDLMKPFANAQRETLTAGYALSSIYVIDMAKEHYWYWKKRKLLQEFIRQHKIYDVFLALAEHDVSKKQYKEYLLLNNHPILFMLKHKTLGLIVRTIKFIRKLPIVANFLYKREFTNKNSYI